MTKRFPFRWPTPAAHRWATPPKHVFHTFDACVYERIRIVRLHDLLIADRVNQTIIQHHQTASRLLERRGDDALSMPLETSERVVEQRAALTILCVHGVGLWPGLFDDLDFGSTSAAVTRPGYGLIPAVANLAEQVDGLAEMVAARAPAALVGVSGGATLALACAARGIDGLVAAVSHEPLIGHLEPEIDDRVRGGANALEATPTPEAAEGFLEGLYGAKSWQRMPAVAHLWAADHIATICREVRHFSEYQPPATEVRTLPVPHLTTVGAHSSAARHRVAALLAGGSSDVATIDNCGHHVLIDQPDDFAAAVHRFLLEVT